MEPRDSPAGCRCSGADSAYEVLLLVHLRHAMERKEVFADPGSGEQDRPFAQYPVSVCQGRLGPRRVERLVVVWQAFLAQTKPRQCQRGKELRRLKHED